MNGLRTKLPFPPGFRDWAQGDRPNHGWRLSRAEARALVDAAEGLEARAERCAAEVELLEARLVVLTERICA